MHTQSAVDGLHEMICNSSFFFDRIVEMMIIVCAELPDMNPVDVLHYLEEFELHIACSRQLQRTRVPAEQWLSSRSREEATLNQRAVRGKLDDCCRLRCPVIFIAHPEFALWSVDYFHRQKL